jgi:hypothetical protein
VLAPALHHTDVFLHQLQSNPALHLPLQMREVPQLLVQQQY